MFVSAWIHVHKWKCFSICIYVCILHACINFHIYESISPLPAYPLPQAYLNQDDSPIGKFHHLSLLEPHKLFQNSVSIFQRRAEGWAEPVYTLLP